MHKRKCVLVPFFLAVAALATFDGGTPDDAGFLADESDLVEDMPDGTDPEAEGEDVGLPGGVSDGGFLYTSDLSDSEIERRFRDEPETLGSASMGFVEAGRLINGVPMPEGDAWTVVSPEAAFGTQETIGFLVTAANAVRAKFPSAPPLRINHIGKKTGGYLRPHHSHQSGRDVDLGFYYPPGIEPSAPRGRREDVMDKAANWALLRALATDADVQVILLDRRVQKVLYDYALSQGEDRAWLDSLFRDGPRAMVQHARRHRDHFHVRFFSGRSQELGRRLQPLLAKRPDENLVVHRVRPGDNLGAIAARYGSSVSRIQKANGLRSTFLSVGRTLAVPLRGACTNCPLPPPVVVPPRRLPPTSSMTGQP